MKNLLRTLQDLFPRSSIAVGGSSARKYICGPDSLEEAPNDLDIYLNVSIWREGFRNMKENILSPEGAGQYETGEGKLSEYQPYRAPHIRRRISVSFPGGEHPTLDFIFLNPDAVPDVKDYLLKYQASAFSECCIYASWGGVHTSTSPKFNSLVVLGKEKKVQVNVHESACSPEHYNKLKKLASRYGVEIVEVLRSFKN